MNSYLEKLKKLVENFPKDYSDINIVLSILINEYENNKSLLEAHYRTADILITKINTNLELITEESYQTIMKNLNDLNTITAPLKDFKYKMDSSSDITEGMSDVELIRFVAAMPESLFTTIQEIKYYQPIGEFDMPNALAEHVNHSIQEAKSYALSGIMGHDLYDHILFPYIEYQLYLQVNNFGYMLDKLANAEMFLIPKYLPPTNFISPSSYLYSKYYADLFKISQSGELQISKITSDESMISKIHNMISSVNEFLY